MGCVVSQICPSYTAGFTGTSPLHDSSAGMIYVNEAPSHRVQCNGTVYAWHYCYYDTRRTNDLEVAFGAYRAVYNEEDEDDDEDEDEDEEVSRYYLRSDSYYLLHLDSRETTFTCDTVDLEEANHFQVYEGDRLGACLRDNDDAEFLDILAEVASSSDVVARWGDSSGQCGMSQMTQSSQNPESISRMILHLYVDISKFSMPHYAQ